MKPDEVLQSLRILIEAQVELPATLLISAATETDNARHVALGLASAFANAGKRTLLVDVTTRPERIAARDVPFDTVSMLPNRDLRAKLDVLRVDRDITIVHAAPLLSHAAGLELARLADGVLIAVRLKRAIRREDELVKNVLDKLDARLLGIVQTSAAVRGPRTADAVGRLPFFRPLHP